MLDRAQEIVSPSGEDAVVRSSVPANHPVDCNEIVVDPESPAGKERADGLASRENSGGGTGVTVTSIDEWRLRYLLEVAVGIVYEENVVVVYVEMDVWFR